MQSDLQLDRKRLPSVSSKNPPANSILQLIKQKKIELSRQLQELDAQQIYLPNIPQEKFENKHKQTYEESSKIESSQPSTPNQQKRSNDDSSRNKFKTILSQMEPFHKSKVYSHAQPPDKKVYKSKQESKSEKQPLKAFVVKSYNRTKTQAKGKEKHSYSRNTKGNMSISKAKQIQKTHTGDSNESIQKFCTYIEHVPKNMKERNEENLTKTITQLQKFNPFFNRNTRIINVCLLKMGKIVFKIAPEELYKCGDELSYFYIVLLGKVKIVEGSFRKVCETGQTVLEQVLFSDSPRKFAMQRGKVVSSAYLLQMKVQQYKKLKEQLIRHGLKHHFQQMQSIIKRNFIIKNWMRNKKK